MSLQEIETNINGLSFEEKTHLALNLLQDIQANDEYYDEDDFNEELISRSEAGSEEFINSKEVFRELNSKYL